MVRRCAFWPFQSNTPDWKLSKIAVFIENIFKIYKKTYPFEFGGGWGLLVFHKYFLVNNRKNLYEF